MPAGAPRSERELRPDDEDDAERGLMLPLFAHWSYIRVAAAKAISKRWPAWSDLEKISALRFELLLIRRAFWLFYEYPRRPA